MLNGSIDIRVIGVSPLRDIASEKMIPPAIASTKPSPALPDVPSVAERLAALLKIEPPRGDEMRNLGPRDDVGRPIFYEAINAGKVARRMDLKNARTTVSPIEGLKLEDKQSVNRALLQSGASISEMNCVRRHLSAIKGGRRWCCFPKGPLPIGLRSPGPEWAGRPHSAPPQNSCAIA